MQTRSVHALGALALALAGGCSSTPQNPPIDEVLSTDLAVVRADMARPRDLAIPDGGDAGEPDTTAPTITIDSPQPGDFVGGVVEVSATIKDTTGVDDNTVLAVFAGDLNFSFPLKRQGQGSTTFIGRYNTRLLAKTIVLPVLSVRATDTLGNAAEIAEEVVLDVVGPQVSLDPPVVHAYSISNMSCSHPFDPVGTEAANDGDVVGQLITLRARIEDTGNRASGQRFVLPSRVDQGSVRLFVSPASLGPLVVDTGSPADRHCDDIDPNLVPSKNNVVEKNKAIAVQLQAIEAGGNPDFSEGPYDPVCKMTVGIPGAKNGPPQLCINNSLTIVKTYWFNFAEPSIYGIPPFTKPPAENCFGLQFDAGNRGLPEGETLCAAVVAYDKVGNRSVSAPLRLCMETRPGTKCAGWLPKVNECVKPADCQTGVLLNTGDIVDAYAKDEIYQVR